ncbi:MAG: GDP-mannose 4,6-dehydratase [Actinobacteria bacterium]|jgi:GDPmannose 4,6-dehydratase|uniref:GDP-mannose 4,6-dehydratase n=1 Tax=freshwater metagenome TaxID=449393 RepID=A0A6J6MVL1_9ZZZZ|nr:GDP-mannose 4,6-dehydratase [Actinomycetota bacterium]
MKSKVALITGVTGQDGSYLAELLLSKGYEVHGLIRRSSTFNTSRIDHIYQDPHDPNPKLFLHYGDLIDGVGLTNLIREIKPDEVYNLGAQSHVQVSFTMPQYTGQVDAVGAVGLLEALRSADINARFYQASTSELYGSTPPPQNEESPFHPRSPYAAAKLMAYWCTVNYREGYGMHATNGILFNHESPRRGETFVTRKITRAVAEIAKGSKKKLFLGNLDAVRDWGYAKEYVESMWLMLQKDKPSDYVVATGVGATVKDFAEAAFSHAGLNWQDHIEVDQKYIRPTEVDALIGDPSKATKELNWKATTHWKELAGIMVDADIAAK